jgi:hypothetical protein
VPFRDPDAGDLATRIEAALRQRLEDAVDAACLEAMTRRRQALDQPPPAADSALDRAEYHEHVAAFVDFLRSRLASSVSAEVVVSAGATGRVQGGPVERELARQIALARALPDYWQRFDECRLLFVERRAGSGRERRGFLGRLLGGG